MKNFEWGTDKARCKEWAYAKKRLAFCSNGTKLRRKDHSKLEHSFIIIDGKIMAMGRDMEHLGEGCFGVVKLCQEENGALWAVKISPIRAKRENFFQLKQEENTVNDLNIGLKATTRKRRNFFFQLEHPKHYLAMQYLGESLEDYLASRVLSELECYDLAVKILSAVQLLHSGAQSREHKQYTHNDLALRNLTIDEQGNVHLIDFGLSHHPMNDDLNIDLADPLVVYHFFCKLNMA